MWAAKCVIDCLRECTHASVYVCTQPRASVCVLGRRRTSGEYGWNMVLIWLFAQHSPPPPAGPVPWRFLWAIWSDEGGGSSWAEGWGVRFILAGCETGSITSQQPCWVTTLLWKRAGWLGKWGACHWPSASVKSSVALSIEKAAGIQTEGGTLALDFCIL